MDSGPGDGGSPGPLGGSKGEHRPASVRLGAASCRAGRGPCDHSYRRAEPRRRADTSPSATGSNPGHAPPCRPGNRVPSILKTKTVRDPDREPGGGILRDARKESGERPLSGAPEPPVSTTGGWYRAPKTVAKIRCRSQDVN